MTEEHQKQPYDNVLKMVLEGQQETLLLQLFSEEIICLFSILLRRARRLPSEETVQLKERLRMYDSLLDEGPYLQERDALAEARGEVRGEVKALRRAVVTIIRRRYPQL